MQVELLYGSGSILLQIPVRQVSALLEAKPLPAIESEEFLISEALRSPIQSPPLAEIVAPGEKVTIVIGDMTRLWVKHECFLPHLLNELNRCGVSDSDITLISATGDHRRQSSAEHRMLTGDEVFSRAAIYDHSSTAKEDLISLGTTSYGTPVKVNQRVVETDRVIITGGIVYHFLAGWGGGKKAIIPGVAARETIMANHALAFSKKEGVALEPAVRAGKNKGNPCSEDMLEGTAMVAPDFLLNTVINEDSGKIAAVFAGDYQAAHEAGCGFVDYHFMVPLPERSEVVVASCGGYPKDINFYQSYKTIYNAERALKPGGTLFLISECREGVGSEQFFKIFTEFSTNRERELYLKANYSIGGQMAYHSALIAKENDLLILSALPDDIVKSMGMIPVKTVAEGLVWIERKHGRQINYCLMPHGGSTLPAPV